MLLNLRFFADSIPSALTIFNRKRCLKGHNNVDSLGPDWWELKVQVRQF